MPFPIILVMGIKALATVIAVTAIVAILTFLSFCIIKRVANRSSFWNLRTWWIRNTK